MERRLSGVLLAVIAIVIAFSSLWGAGAGAGAEVTEQDVYDYINCCLEVSARTKATLLEAFKKGFQEGAITPERALKLLQRVNESGAPIPLREQVLLTIAEALLRSVPVEMLLSKVEEGLAKGRPMDEILWEIRERKATLEEVKALLEGKGFVVGLELQLGAVTVNLTFELAGKVITAVAEALEDYVRGGGDPADEIGVKQAVILRLQRDRSIPREITTWLEATISGKELSQIAQGIAQRLEQQKGGR